MHEILRPDPDRRPRLSSIVAAARRSRGPRLAVTVIGALILAGLVDQVRDDAADRARAWGAADAVWVATGALDAGATIGPGDVERRVLPEIALPSDPVRDSPIGERLRTTVAEGEILRGARIAASDVGRLAARLPQGTGAISLPTAAGPLSPGDVVDLFALLSGEPVAREAVVIAVVDGHATVAVTLAEIPAVVRSFTTGDVVAVVVG